MTLARTLRGRVLAPDLDTPRWTDLADALVEVGGDGRIVDVRPAPPASPIPETWPGCVLLPGFVDAHVHYPQTRMVGTASGPLLDWLASTTFPEEARFADRAYADAVAAEFCGALASAGTTLACVYGSPHPVATDRLFRALDAAGLRALAGLTLMDRGAPPANLLDARLALEALDALADRWHGHDDGRLGVVVTPRFALSCTPAMLRGAADLARRRGLAVQTHLSENTDEVRVAAELFPASADYLGAYADHGLLEAGAIFAHCIHLSDDEWARLVAAGAVVAHCPDSNFFLGSGVMPLAAALDRGARVALGSDVGAGRAFSMRRIAARAYDASLVAGARVAPDTLLWLATRGGAVALGQGDRTGALAPGLDADLVAVPVPAGAAGGIIDHLLFREDHGPVRAAMVRGRVVHEA